MKTNLFISFLFFQGLFGPAVYAQQNLMGIIRNQDKQAVPLASISIKHTYDGTTSDSSGYFSFKTNQKTPFWIIISAMGFHPDSIYMDKGYRIDTLHIELKERLTALNTVSISAGSFVSGVHHQGIALSPIEIATIAGASADIFGAMRTLPGAGVSFGETGLSVRGGSPGETKMFIDGLLVKNPFNNQVPDISARGRFSVFQFKNIAFSTGGYSAQYGQALSSALSQETQDLPEKTYTRITALSLGGEAEQYIRHNNTALILTGNYYNLATSNHYLNPQQTNWSKDPEQGTLGFQFIQKIAEKDIFKIYLDHSIAKAGIQNYFDYRSNTLGDMDMDNRNTYLNSTYAGWMNNHWKWNAGFSYQLKQDEISLPAGLATRSDRFLQGRALATYLLGNVSAIRFGGEFFYSDQSEALNDSSRNYQDRLAAAFIEADVFLTRKLVFRAGLRGEHSQYLEEQKIAPRIMLAYKTGSVSQIAFNYGRYFQNPADEYLLRQALGFQQSENYTLNYEYLAEGYTFRSELYYKNYDALVKDFGSYLDNSGNGFARGLDLFWRDKKTFQNIEYRISYSFLDTKRNYQDFPYSAMPTFASKHTLNFLYRQYFEKLNSQIFTTYTFASGRSYLNPNNLTFLGDKGPDYHNFSLGANYFTNFWKQFTVVFINIDNLLGINQVYGYRFDQENNNRYTVLPAAKRSILFGFVVSIGDRTFKQD